MDNRSTGRLPQHLKSGSRAPASRRTRLRWAVGLGATLELLANTVSPNPAHADPPPALRVGGPNALCPTTKQVAALLERMLVRTKITADTGPPGAVEATVSDHGAYFRVTVAGQERSFDDAARQCAERARHAAVFLALVLDPLMTADLAPEPPAVAAPPAPPVDSARPSGERGPQQLQWEMTLGGAMFVAPAAERRRTAVAEGIAVFARAKRGFHLALGAGVLHGSLHFDAASADAWWAPIDVAAGFSTRASAWEIGAELGPNASILFIAGENLKQAERQVRVEVGGRVSLWSRFWLTQQFAMFLAAEAVVRPFPHILDIDPRGGIGQMPAIWLGASAGLATSLL
jgi:hypothetical protein